MIDRVNTHRGALFLIVLSLLLCVGSGVVVAQIDDGDVGDNVDDGDVGDNVDDGDVGDNVDDGTDSGEEVSLDGEPSSSISIPDSPTTGEEVTVTVETDLPSIETGTPASRELSVQLFVNGEEVDSNTVNVDSGQSSEVEFTHTFDSSGENEVTVETEYVVEGEFRTVTATGSATVVVDVSDVAPETSAIEGVSFTVPESLEDEVNDYKSDSPEDLSANAFVLATQDELYVVFTQQEPTKGLASVEGPVLDQELSTGDLTYGVIAATSVSFETSGTEVSIPEVVDNSDDYRLNLVNINSHYRRASILTDPDEGEDFTASSTAGALINDPNTDSSVVRNIGEKARAVSRDATQDDIRNALNNPQGDYLPTFSFETKYWADADASVDGIVLDPAGEAKRFVEAYTEPPVTEIGDSRPILYVVEEDFQPQEVSDVSNVKSNSLDGEVVEITTRLYQGKLSVQETIEHGTEQCGEDRVPVQTPEGTACVNIGTDVLLQSGAAWTTVPQSTEDVLPVIGASSHHQDQPTITEEGRYRIVGEVVSSSRVDTSVTDGFVFIIYNIEKTGEIDYDEVADESKVIIETRTDQLRSDLQQQIREEDVELSFSRSTETAVSVTPDEAGSISFSRTGSTAVSLQRANINVSTEVDELSVTAAEVSLPGNIEEPPRRSLRLLNISSNVDEETISGASLELEISRSTVADVADVQIYRYHDGEWAELNTTVVREDGESSVVIEAETEGFSYFAVTTEDSTQSTENTGSEGSGSTDDGAPGFTFFSVVVALFSFIGIQMKRS